MKDEFSDYAISPTAPAEAAEAISPSDASGVEFVTRALYVGDGGDIRVKLLRGSVVTLRSVPSGSFMPLRITQVFATGTTASSLVGMR